jgi:cell division protease FtsH
MTYGTGEEVFLGKDLTAKKDYSEEVAAQIDREIRDIIDNAYGRAEKLLSENIDKLHEVANALLQRETLNADEFEIVFKEGLEALERKEKQKEGQTDKKVDGIDPIPGDLADIKENEDINNDMDEDENS